MSSYIVFLQLTVNDQQSRKLTKETHYNRQMAINHFVNDFQDFEGRCHILNHCVLSFGVLYHLCQPPHQIFQYLLQTENFTIKFIMAQKLCCRG